MEASRPGRLTPRGQATELPHGDKSAPARYCLPDETLNPGPQAVHNVSGFTAQSDPPMRPCELKASESLIACTGFRVRSLLITDEPVQETCT